MKKVGIGAYEPRMLRIMQTIGLGLTSLLLLYAIGVSASIFDDRYYSGNLMMVLLMTSWILYDSYNFRNTPSTPKKMALHIALYHVYAMTYIFFIIGFSSPILACWAIMYFISYIYFSYLGLAMSIMFFTSIWMVFVFTHNVTASELTNQTVTVICGISVGLFAILLSRLQESDRRKLERSQLHALRQEEALSTVINSATQAIITVSSTGKIKLFNAAFMGLIDTNKSLENANVADILHLVDESGKKVSLFSLMKKDRHFERDDLSMKIDENDSMRLRINVNNIQSSYGSKRADEYVCTLRDITKEKSLEEERDEFISVVSHELRTPITIAEGTISNAMLMLDRPDTAPDKIKTGVKLAHDQVKFLASMVNDLSTLSRAERGVADAGEEINVAELAQKLFAEYSPQAQQKGLRMDLDVGTQLGSVTTSRLYLEELLQNFITNAIKYTKEGNVLLTIKRQNDVVLFAVKDSGIGISKSDQARIFEKFYRSEDYRTRETGGTGLGLYVAAKLARKIGTTIEIKSRLNYGSTFSITLKSSTK